MEKEEADEEIKTHLFERETLGFGDEEVNVEPSKHERAKEDEQDQRANVHCDLRSEEPKQEVPDPVCDFPPISSASSLGRYRRGKPTRCTTQCDTLRPYSEREALSKVYPWCRSDGKYMR